MYIDDPRKTMKNLGTSKHQHFWHCLRTINEGIDTLHHLAPNGTTWVHPVIPGNTWDKLGPYDTT